ncbi:MAG: Hsp20/alpha crystallin family protein [Vicinamibacterales bacterium]
MFRLTRTTPYDDLFNFQREVDRLFNQFWTDLPTRTAAAPATSFQAAATDDGWTIDVPMPGIDPKFVSIEAAGNTLTIKAEEPAGEKTGARLLFEQTLTVPQFLDLDKIGAAHRHGMLHLTLPLKEAVKPRRIQIDVADSQPQLVGAR